MCLYKDPRNFRRYRPWPSGIPALEDFLTFSCGARVTWSQNFMKPGWLNQDDAHQTITCLIGMDCASQHAEKFSTPSLISLFCSPPPPYKNLCLHWEGEMGFETWVPHLSDGQHLNKPLSLTSAPAFQVLAFTAAGSWTCVRLQFLVTPDGTMWTPVGPGWPGQGAPSCLWPADPMAAIAAISQQLLRVLYLRNSSCSPSQGISRLSTVCWWKEMGSW